MKKLLVMDSPIGKLTLIEENKELISLIHGFKIYWRDNRPYP